MKEIISHIKYDDIEKQWVIQSNEEHQLNVAELTETFANKIGIENFGYIIGLLHDKGKESPEFQEYIRIASGYINGKLHKKVPHAYIGALIAYKKFSNSLLSYPIMCHHTGLYDIYEYSDNMNKNIPDTINEHINIDNTDLKIKDNYNETEFHHLIRILFSCLVDADYLDTERFMDFQKHSHRKKKKLCELLPLLESYLKKLSSDAPDTFMNEIRQFIQDKCRESAIDEPGFYSLNVQTGCGKTLSSLLWAMLHAIKHNKDRIIISIPYTSIICQTAEILRDIFGTENVLEHHSVYDLNTLSDDELKCTLKLATENWDYPIIVTTNVQLFESMYSNKPSMCRKLHNICNSVIILDEVQIINTKHLQPIINALDTYQKHFKTSVLFTTASLPVLTGIHITSNHKRLNGLVSIKEIVTDINLNDILKRVKLNFFDKPVNYDSIINKLKMYSKNLCIVNTRKDAFEIYNRLEHNENTYHLSKNMCSEHIKNKIQEIKMKLKDETITDLFVVSTQLIEAGVDIDFPVVFRQIAGLDSILQSAGRCNREGKHNTSDVYIFELRDTDVIIPPDILNGINAMKNITDNHDWFSVETINEYYIKYYKNCSSFDVFDIEKKATHFNFEKVSNDFHLIDNSDVNIIVNYENSFEILEDMKTDNIINKDSLKKISKYIVNVSKKSFEVLNSKNKITKLIDGLYILDKDSYDSNYGIIF